MGTAATANDFWRLAERARETRIRIYEEPISGDHFATSGSNPRLLYRVTGFSCTCKGFVHHQRCMHHAALLAELGWLPDPDTDPAGPAAAAPVEDGPDPWDEPPVAAVPVVLPANVVAFPSAEGRAAALAETVEDAVGRLAGQLAEGRTGGFAAYLRFVARFHRYFMFGDNRAGIIFIGHDV